MKPRILIDDKIPFIQGALEPVAEVLYLPGAGFTPELTKEANALIVRTRTKCTPELLADSSVQYIATATIGYDHIDRPWCAENNVLWNNAPGCNALSVQQYMASALLVLKERYQLNLEELTVGVVGVGNVGKRIVDLSKTFNMKTLLNDPPVEEALRAAGKTAEADQYCSLEQVLTEADIITLHTPLERTGDHPTFHLMNAEILEKLNQRSKPVFLINTCRGEVIDTVALKKTLQNRQNLYAVLDVWENEPAIDLELLDLVDIATPHIAGYSADGKGNGSTVSVRAISSFFNLGLDDWSAALPAPAPLPDTLPDLAPLELLQWLMLYAYDITEDDQKLRKSPDKFEWFRGNYPIRRELHAYPKITKIEPFLTELFR